MPERIVALYPPRRTYFDTDLVAIVNVRYDEGNWWTEQSHHS